MRHGRALSTPLHHRSPLSPAPTTVSWRRMLWRGVVALARRPLLALTLGIVLVLLIGTASEALAARSLERRVTAQQWRNRDLQVNLQYVTQHTHISASPAAITAAALRLGMTLPSTPTPTP